MIFKYFFLGLMYIVPVLQGCSLLEDNFINLYGIENEIIYQDIGELFALEQENYLVLESTEDSKNIRIIQKIELETDIPLQLENDPLIIKLDILNQNKESNILIMDEDQNFIEYSLLTNQITKVKLSEYDQTFDLQDVIQLTDQDKKYLILDFSLIAQTYILLFEETFNEYKQISALSLEFYQNSGNNQIVGSGNTFYRINFQLIEIYQIEDKVINEKGIKDKVIKQKGQIIKSINQEECGPSQDIIQHQLHQNSISFIDPNTLVITQLTEDHKNQKNQKCIKFTERLYTYNYYEPLDQYVVISQTKLVFGNFQRNLNLKNYYSDFKVYLTQNYILLAIGLNVELYSKELIFLDQIQNEKEFLIEVQPEADKFILIDKNHAKQYQLIESQFIKITQEHQDIDFIIKQITEENTCNINVHFSFVQINYDDLFVKLEKRNFVPSNQWAINDCQQQGNLVSIIEQRNQQKKTRFIRELPSLSKLQYILLENENNEFQLIVQSKLLNTYEEFTFKLDIEVLLETDQKLWWVFEDEVYFAFYQDDTCNIFKLDYGILRLMFHKEIKMNNKILKIVSSGNYIFILIEQKVNLNVLFYTSVSEDIQEYKKIQLSTIKDIFASPLLQGYIIIKQDRQLIIFCILYIPVQIFNEIVQPLQTNVIIFQNYFVVLMKSSNEKEKICDIYFLKSTLSIEKLGRNPLENFSQIQIDDVLVSTNENVFYLKCQVKIQQMKRYVLVGFKIGKSIYKSLLFILLRNIDSEFQAISQLLIKLNKNQLMPLIYLKDSQICLLNENDEIIKDFEPLNEKEIDLVDGDNKPSIIDNSDDQKNDQDNQDNNDDQSDDNTLDLDTSNFQIGSFLVMSTIEEALIYSLFKTFGRRRIEPIDVV